MAQLHAVEARLQARQVQQAAYVNNKASFANGYEIKAPTRKHRTLISYQGDGTAMATNPEGKTLTLDVGSFTTKGAANTQKLKDWAQLELYSDIRVVVKQKRIKYMAGIPLEGKHPATQPKAAKPTKLTVGDTVVDKGNITYQGKPVGTIKQGLKHGYHPIHRLILKLPNGATLKTDFEVDEFKDDKALVTYINEQCETLAQK